MIRTLNMTDVGPYSEKIYNFSNGVNVVTGGNHKGKSTIRQAIRTGLTGRPDKKELAEIVRNVPDAKCRIGIVTDFGGQTHHISRGVLPNTLKLNDAKLQLGKSLDKDGLHDFGYKRNVLAMLCDASHFFELEPPEQNAILMNYFTGDDEIDVTKYGIAPEDADMFAGLKMSNIKKFSDQFFENRATVNKANMKAKAEIELINERAAKAEKFDFEILASEALALKNKINAPGVMPPPRPPELLLIEQEIVIKQDQHYKSDLAEKLIQNIARGTAIKNTLTPYHENKGFCPLSAGKVKCDSPSLAEMMAALEKERTDLIAEYRKMKAEDDAARVKFEAEKANKIQALKDSRDSVAGEWESAKIVIATQNFEIEKGKEHFRNRLSEIQMKNREAEALEIEKVNARNLVASIATSEKESKRLTGFIDFLTKDLKEKIVSGNSGGLFEKINNTAGKFGFCVEAEGGDLSKIKINGRTTGMLSTSERIICGISLQLAVAELSGYNFIVCDDLESIEAIYFNSLVTVLNKSFRKITSILIGLNLPDPGNTANYYQL